MRRYLRLALILWAVLGVPVAFGFYVFWSYNDALTQGKLPFAGLSEIKWYVFFLLFLASGILCLLKLPDLRRKTQIIASGLYLLLMAIVLVAVHFLVACSMGDCL
jgi:hypothetical protein